MRSYVACAHANTHTHTYIQPICCCKTFVSALHDQLGICGRRCGSSVRYRAPLCKTVQKMQHCAKRPTVPIAFLRLPTVVAKKNKKGSRKQQMSCSNVHRHVVLNWKLFMRQGLALRCARATTMHNSKLHKSNCRRVELSDFRMRMQTASLKDAALWMLIYIYFKTYLSKFWNTFEYLRP